MDDLGYGQLPFDKDLLTQKQWKIVKLSIPTK